MKHLTALTIIALGVMLVFSSCVTVCPKQSVVEMVWTPIGPMVVQTERDTYCEERHSLERFLNGTGWLTAEEYDAYTEQFKQELEEEKPDGTI